MSKLVRGSEFMLAMQQWTRVYMPMVGRDQDAWEDDWVAILTELPYLRVAKKERSFQLDRLIGLRLQMNYLGANMKMVKDDLERVWSEQLAEGMDGYHTITDTDEGFEFQFAGLPKKTEYISGVITVLQKKTR
ncbi:MAG: hypothetical protein H7Y17_12035 [Chlorobia bacterium]|nr:hypothetical protein [Fimbriimonadaceae bacterium]